MSIVQYSGMTRAHPRSLLFPPQGRDHTVNLVVIEGSAAFKERLGVVLRELRRNTVGERGKSLTQAEAAEAIGTDTDTIGRWERGQNLPGLDVLGKIAATYQLPREKQWILLDPPALPARVSPLEEILSAQPLQPTEVQRLEDAIEAADRALGEGGQRPAHQPDAEDAQSRPA